MKNKKYNKIRLSRLSLLLRLDASYYNNSEIHFRFVMRFTDDLYNKLVKEICYKIKT